MFPLSLQSIISSQMRPQRLRGAWSSRLLRHPARRRSGSILSPGIHTGLLTYSFSCRSWSPDGRVSLSLVFLLFPFFSSFSRLLFMSDNVSCPHLFTGTYNFNCCSSFLYLLWDWICVQSSSIVMSWSRDASTVLRPSCLGKWTEFCHQAWKLSICASLSRCPNRSNVDNKSASNNHVSLQFLILQLFNVIKTYWTWAHVEALVLTATILPPNSIPPWSPRSTLWHSGQ